MNSRTLKRNARLRLREKTMPLCTVFFAVIAAYLLLCGCEYIVRLMTSVPLLETYNQYSNALFSIGLSAAFAVVHMLLVFPLMMGAIRWVCIIQTDDSDQTPGSVETLLSFFSVARRYRTVLTLQLYLLVRGIGFWLLCMLPAGIALILRYDSLYRMAGMSRFSFLASGFHAATPVLWVVGWIVFAIGMLPCVVTVILTAGGGFSLSSARRLTKRVLHGRRRQLLWLAVSTAGWWVSAILIIPAIWVIPYLTACIVQFVRQAAAQNGKTRHVRKRYRYASSGIPSHQPS